MSPQRRQQIEDLYRSARLQPAGERDTFITTACGSDHDLRNEILYLLAQDELSGKTSDPDGNAVTKATDPLMMSHEGGQLGPYKIEALLGAGGMGKVYRATDTRLNRKVAVKISTEPFSGRFEREARAISAFNHPNICTLYDVGPNYLVMELLDGSTLADEIKRGPMDPAQAASYGSQIASALAEAHSRGIVHRDLKPGNIFVTRHGLKVLDFGLARMVFETSVTEPNMVMGTPAYMAPEQVEGREADARMDLFALGLILYEMTSGILPFPGKSLARIMVSGSAAVIPTLSELRPDVPASLDALVAKLLKKDPDQRCQSAAEVAAQLSALADQLTAPPASAVNFLLRPAVLIPAALVLLSTILGGAWLYQRSERRRWAGENAIPEINRLSAETRPLAAFQLLVQAEKILPGDPRLAQAAQSLTRFISVNSSKPGARVEIQDYFAPDGAWYSLGITPMNHVRIPDGYFRWKISRTGGGEFVSAPVTGDSIEFPFEMTKDVDDGMVPVPGGTWEVLSVSSALCAIGSRRTIWTGLRSRIESIRSSWTQAGIGNGNIGRRSS